MEVALERPQARPGRRAASVRGGRRAVAAAILTAAVTGLPAMPPAAQAQQASDVFIGCFAEGPGGSVLARIERSGGRLVIVLADRPRRPLVPASAEDKRTIAEEIGLSARPGNVSIVAGVAEEDGSNVLVVLSSTISFAGHQVKFVGMDVDGLFVLFPVNCR